MRRGAHSYSRPRREERDVEAGASLATMEVDIPGDLAGRIIGKGGSTAKRIERATGATVRVETSKVEGGRACVVAKGDTEQVNHVFKEVQAEVAKVSETIAEQLKPRFKDKSSSAGAGLDDLRSAEDGRTSRKEGQDGGEWTYEDMEADITVSASLLTFKCLVGTKGENITKIRKECDVNIKLQDRRDVKEIQRAYISGPLEGVMRATRMVKESLESYDPDLDHSVKEESVNKMDLSIIKATAKVKIIGSAAGFLIGKNGQQLKRIKDESNIDAIHVDRSEDEEGFKCVEMSGYITPVLEGLQRVQGSMRNFSKVNKRASSVETREEMQMAPPARTSSRGSRQTEAMQTTAGSAMASTTPQPYSPSQTDPPGAPPVPAQAYAFKDASGNSLRFIREADGRYSLVIDKAEQLDPVPLSLQPPPMHPPGLETCDSPQQRNPPANKRTASAGQVPAQKPHQSQPVTKHPLTSVSSKPRVSEQRPKRM